MQNERGVVCQFLIGGYFIIRLKLVPNLAPTSDGINENLYVRGLDIRIFLFIAPCLALRPI